MRVYDLPYHVIETVVAAIGRDYDDNLYAADLREHVTRNGLRCTFVIRCRSSRGPGARRSWRGHRMVAASWEVHREVIGALFDAGATRVTSRLADYRGPEDFDAKYAATYFAEVGPPISPVYIGDL